MRNDSRMTERYTVEEDLENDCLTVTDNEYTLTNSFGSDNLILGNIEDSTVIMNRLNFLEAYTKELEENLKYYDFTEENFKDIREEVELNME